MSNISDIIIPLDTSDIGEYDSIEQQKERSAYNRLKQALAENKCCWNCSRFTYCVGGFCLTRVCKVIKSNKNLYSIYKQYKELRTQGLKIREKRNMQKRGKLHET